MNSAFWRRWWQTVFSSRATRRPSVGRPRRALRLEALEDRSLPSGTPVMVLDINPGGTSALSELVAVGPTTYFRADDGVHGSELWKSDGTEAGTTLVADINPGSGSSGPTSLANVNGTLFFAAGDDTHGYELWKSDGTAAGTTLVKDINPGSGGSGPTSLRNVNGTLFFAADDGTNGKELWVSDGTAAGTVLVKDINPGSASSNANWSTNVNGTLFFTAYDGTHGRELWKSDGTAAGTTLVKDIDPYPGDAWGRAPRYLTAVNGTLFFAGYDAVHGTALWKSDGTAAGTTLVKDIYPISGNSYLGPPRFLTAVNGTLFFQAGDGRLWKSDGTAAGTLLFKDIYPGSGMTNVNGTLFFAANDVAHGYELWKSDGTAAGTTLVKDINPGTHIEYYYVYPYNWEPREVANSSSPGFLTNVNGTLFFTADDGTGSPSLWQSDGTEAGTVLAANLSVSWLTNGNGTLFFAADDGVHGSELWVVPRDGPSSPAVNINDVTVAEGHSGTQTATFTVTLSAASSQTVTVAYATSNDTATAGSDYQAASGTFTFAPGEIEKTISVLVNGDTTDEDNETFVVYLTGAANAAISDDQGVGTISDDDAPPSLAISDAQVTEGNTGAATATFRVTLSAVSGRTVSVNYSTSDGTALAGSDYTARSGLVTFAPGETSKTVAVAVIGDRVFDANETFFVNLSGATNATIADDQGIGTIVDDEPRVSISDVSKKEGNGKKTTLFTFTVTLSAAYDQPVTMSFQTVNGTATTGDNDYVARTGTLTFAPGQTTRTITIEVKSDGKKEADETFYLDLFGLSSNALFSKNRGIGTILNDD